MKIELEMKLDGVQDVAKLVAIGLIVAAIVNELRKPESARTWQGKVAGWVPYDFRPPTPGRAIRHWWSPDNPNILVPVPFGVGWTLNFGRVVRQLCGIAS